MKKIIALASLLTIVAACTPQPTTNTGMPSNANNTESKSTLLPVSEADMIAKEKAVWEALQKRDFDAFGNMLAREYLEVTDGGAFDKAGIMADIKEFNLTDASFADWKMIPIDNDAVILTYNLNLKGTFKGAAVPPGPYRTAAAWVSRDGKWQAIYYQQTLTMPPPPPAPPAKSTQPAKPATSPAANPPEAGPDPIANEKIVWETFKSKNFDAFAALLDPEFVEITATGVYDKSGTVQAVSEFDAGQFELSDWKSAKLDDDASVVTYLVKPSDPKWDQERHSSIWANRGGKWRALFHMSTPVAKPAVKPATKSSPRNM